MKFIKATTLLASLLISSMAGLSFSDEKYNVNFFDDNGNLIQTKTVSKGDDATFTGDLPEKSKDKHYSYDFLKWNVSLENIQHEINAYPVFQSHYLKATNTYDEDVAKWSEPGHLYIHYNRGENVSYKEYEEKAIWLWQNAPQDLEGTLWGASNPKVLDNFHAMSNHWMPSIPGVGEGVDEAGAIMDIDLNIANLVGGKSGKPTKLAGATRMGFLIVHEESMGGEKHWTSDGDANNYIDEFDKHLAEKGFLHIYCNKGSVGDFTFKFTGEYVTNPTIDDTTGKYRSHSDMDSSKEIFNNTTTSEDFKSLGVGYQIFVASFRDSNGDGLGDIRGIIDSLGYLKDLGVDVLWLTPIQKSESYHGYDITDFYQIDSKFGTLNDYRELIYKAHQNGMKVLMDFVVNHTSKNNVWFKKSSKAVVETDNFGNTFNYRDMYHWKYLGDPVLKYNHDTEKYEEVPVEEHGDWYRSGESNYYYYGKFGSGMAELNYDCQATRDFVINMALYWLGFGLDGFRLDAVKHIYMKDEVSDTKNDIIIEDYGQRTFYDEEMMKERTVDFDYSSDLTKNVLFWKEFGTKLKRQYPNCFLVGENFDGWGEQIAPYYNSLDSQFDFSLYFHTNECVYMQGLTGQSYAKNFSNTQFSETYDVFSRMGGDNPLGETGVKVNYGQRPDFINGAFTSNHDVNRAINRVNLGYHINKKNLRETDKYVEVTGTDKEINKAKFHAAATILAPGISWIYYGDELGMTGNVNTHKATYGSENNIDIWFRQPFKWGKESITPSYKVDRYQIEFDNYNKTKLKSLKEQLATDKDNDMLDFYKGLIAVKKLYGKNAKYVPNDNEVSSMTDVYSFKVKTETSTLTIYINCGISNKTYNVNSKGIISALNNATTGGQLPPYGVIVRKA